MIEELSKEKERCALTANDLKDCQEKLTTAESRLDVVIKELHHVSCYTIKPFHYIFARYYFSHLFHQIKDEERKEPKEKLRAEVSSLKSEILELSNAIIGFKKTISILQEDLLVAQEANRRLDEVSCLIERYKQLINHTLDYS